MNIRRLADIITKGLRGEDPTADLFLGENISPECQQCLDIYKSDIRRFYIEACLLTGADKSKVAEIVEINQGVIELYEQVFFPVNGLSRMEKLYHIDSCKDSYEQNLKRWAFTQGIDFIAWRLGAKVEVVPVQTIQSLHTDCYFKAKEAFFNPNAAESSKEALKWVKQAAELSRILKAWVSNNHEAMQDIELALKSIDIGDIDFGDIANMREENGEETPLEAPGLELGDIDQILKDNGD